MPNSSARLIRSSAAAVAAVLLVSLAAVPVAAAESVTFTTAYPAVQVDPGGEVTFPLVVETAAPDRVDIEIVEAPEGFETALRGGGFLVGAVHTGGETPPELELEVTVPADAPPGPQRILLRASSPPATADLELEIAVSDTTGGSVALETDFPVLRGASDSSFTFDLTLTNETAQELTFGLEAVGPPGWEVEARPSGETQAATAVVAAGDEGGITVSVTPDALAEAGQYPISVRASSGDQSAESELVVELTGSPSLTVEPTDGRLNVNVTGGASSAYTLVVSNGGTAPASNVELTATPPSGWTVTFEPATLPALDPLAEANVTATITPSEDAVAGDYVVTITATGDEGSDEIQVRTTVETSPLWGYVGLGLIALVLVGLFLVFRRFGRR